MMSACVAFDELSVAELEALVPAVIAVDAGGTIVAMSAGAARWAGVTAWQVRGRALVRELAWRFGAAAAHRIDEFLRSTALTTSIRALGGGRAGPAVPTDALLHRGASRIYVSLIA